MEEGRLVRMVLKAMTHEDVLATIARRIATEVVDALKSTQTIALEGGEAATVVGDLRIDRERREVEVHGKRIRLKTREFDLLEVLARKPGRVLARESLLSAAWPDRIAYDIDTRTVDVHISRLRRAGIDRIETIAGVGYKLDDRDGECDPQPSIAGRRYR